MLGRQYHQASVQYQRQIVNPLFAVYILRLGLLVSAQFAVIVPDSYHLGVAFPPHPIDRRPADSWQLYAETIPSGFATSAKMSAAFTSCSFLCPALTIARSRALPSATVG